MGAKVKSGGQTHYRRKRPTAAELAAARGATVPDLVAAGLRVLLVGINPGLWSGFAGLHFANPANRLWPVLHAAGLTPRRLRPEDTAELLSCGIGVTNLVPRATARADELGADELRAGRAALEALVQRWQPGLVAVLGLTAYRVAFEQPKAEVGPQPERVGGRPTWLLPNPSGLNAGWRLERLVEAYSDLRRASPGRAEASGGEDHDEEQGH